MKALVTETQRKSFFLFSVSLCLRGNFLSRQRKRKALLCAFVVPFFQGLLRQNDGGFSGMGFNAFLH